MSRHRRRFRRPRGPYVDYLKAMDRELGPLKWPNHTCNRFRENVTRILNGQHPLGPDWSCESCRDLYLHYPDCQCGHCPESRFDRYWNPRPYVPLTLLTAMAFGGPAGAILDVCVCCGFWRLHGRRLESGYWCRSCIEHGDLIRPPLALESG